MKNKATWLAVVAFAIVACSSTESQIHKMSTADLQLRHQQLMYRLSMTRYSWGNRPWQNNAYEDVKDDLEEKEAIERELARRNAPATPVTR